MFVLDERNEELGSEPAVAEKTDAPSEILSDTLPVRVVVAKTLRERHEGDLFL